MVKRRNDAIKHNLMIRAVVPFDWTEPSVPVMTDIATRKPE
jgi:hypothetical protein